MDKKQQTVDTYNSTASRMAEKFNKLGVYAKEIAETFRLIPKKNPFVVEIGCGNGRDAAEICKNTLEYLGLDIAERFIEIARKNVPCGAFEVADVETYSFPDGIDIVFAFASLIHIPKESLRNILERIYLALNPGGIVRISMKHSDEYHEATKTDEFGVRTYFLYSQKDIEELAQSFVILKNEMYELRGQKWIEIILKKD